MLLVKFKTKNFLKQMPVFNHIVIVIFKEYEMFASEIRSCKHTSSTKSF